jgi:hypothetical protein
VALAEAALLVSQLCCFAAQHVLLGGSGTPHCA